MAPELYHRDRSGFSVEVLVHRKARGDGALLRSGEMRGALLAGRRGSPHLAAASTHARRTF